MKTTMTLQRAFGLLSIFILSLYLGVACSTKEAPKAWTVKQNKQGGTIAYWNDRESLKMARDLIDCKNPEIVDDNLKDRQLSQYCSQSLEDSSGRGSDPYIVAPSAQLCENETHRTVYRELTYRCPK